MKVAVVGSGVSGLGAAYLLARAHDVELFERAASPGGHVDTHDADGFALDTGFIVHNLVNYPLLTRLFRELDVPTQDSEMSFSVSCSGCGLEYSGRRPYAQRRNLGRPRYHRFLLEVTRFLRTASPEEDVDGLTLGRYLDERGYSLAFAEHFLVPLTSALWSTAPGRSLEFPAGYALRFFANHGMLGFRRRRWLTVRGGSRVYVQALLERFQGILRLGADVRAVRRDPDGVELITGNGERRRYDKVVLATHADDALTLLADPSDDERRILSAFTYSRNETVLHTDDRLLPAARAARASWNYRLRDCSAPGEPATLTYYLNRLQALHAPRDYCVTLNRDAEIAEDAVIDRMVYTHPLYTLESLAAQRELPALSGPRNTVYAGAHHGFGFHEDGLASGVRAAELLGVSW
jgi:predicted NAD/FAD-binding protein